MSPGTETVAVEAVGLRKHWNTRTVLDGVDLRLHTGEVYSLLGAPGSGKSVVAKVLAHLITPDEGKIVIGGARTSATTSSESDRRIALLTGRPTGYPELTPMENLRLFARMYGLSSRELQQRSDGILSLCGLAGQREQPCHLLPAEALHRLDVALLLLRDPRAIVLDEPPMGFSDMFREVLGPLVQGLVTTGVSLILMTRSPEFAESLGQRVGVLHEGRVHPVKAPEAPDPDDALQRLSMTVTGMSETALKEVGLLTSLQGSRYESEILHVWGNEVIAHMGEIITDLTRHGVSVTGVETARADVRTRYLSLVAPRASDRSHERVNGGERLRLSVKQGLRVVPPVRPGRAAPQWPG